MVNDLFNVEVAETLSCESLSDDFLPRRETNGVEGGGGRGMLAAMAY